MLINRFSPVSSLAQRGIIIVSGKSAKPAHSNGLQERGIIIVGGKPSQPATTTPNWVLPQRLFEKPPTGR